MSNINQSRLFSVAGNDMNLQTTEFVKSPLNYTGGKFKLLPQILPLFPKKIKTFYDLFCGGCNVGINVRAEKVIYNDSNTDLIELYKVFKKYPAQYLLDKIYSIIDKYELSRSDLHGYEYYGCHSSTGLQSYNKERFNKLRSDFNNLQDKDDDYYITLYVLIVYAFNTQIRFNKSHEFNMPVGKWDFHDRLKNLFLSFIDIIQFQENNFSSSDFRTIKSNRINSSCFVYCDPPYLISTACYNEQDGWTNNDETDLLDILDFIDSMGGEICFVKCNCT